MKSADCDMALSEPTNTGSISTASLNSTRTALHNSVLILLEWLETNLTSHTLESSQSTECNETITTESS